jgi:hypothetical protein
MKDALAKESEAGLSVHLALNKLQLRDMTFNHSVIDPPGEPSSYRLLVFLNSCGKGLEFGDFALVHLSQPGIEAFSQALA